MLGTVATKSTHRLGASVDYLPVILVCFTLCCVSYLRVIAIGVYKLWTFVSLSRYRFESPPPHPRLTPRVRRRDSNQFNLPAGRLNSSWLFPARAGNSQLYNAPSYKRSLYIYIPRVQISLPLRATICTVRACRYRGQRADMEHKCTLSVLAPLSHTNTQNMIGKVPHDTQSVCVHSL